MMYLINKYLKKVIYGKTLLKKLVFCWHLEMKIEGSASGSASGSGSISKRHGSADPDPDTHQNVMDPEHCIFSCIFGYQNPGPESGFTGNAGSGFSESGTATLVDR
jgi:hypothetical protein